MGYLEKNLQEGEQPVVRLMFSRWMYAIAAIGVYMAPLFVLIIWLIRRNTVCVVTNKRLICKKGWICKRTMDIMLDKIDTVYFSNGLFGAIFRCGSLKFVSASFLSMSRWERRILKYGMVKNIAVFKKGIVDAIDMAKAENREEQAKAFGRELNGAKDKVNSAD